MGRLRPPPQVELGRRRAYHRFIRGISMIFDDQNVGGKTGRQLTNLVSESTRVSAGIEVAIMTNCLGEISL